MKNKELLKRIEYLENQLSVLSNKINPKHKYTSPYDPKYLKTVPPQDYKTDYIEVTNYDTTATVVSEEKKELVVGKWYKHVDDDGNVFIFNHQKNGKSFGWFKGKWSILVWYTDTFINKKDLIEPTPEEVESALIEEAIKRGHKYDVYSWNHEQNTLYANRGNDVGHDILFENGVWMEVIKPEEKPNVGDLVVMYNSSGKFVCIKNLTEFDKMNSELCPELVSYKLATKDFVFDLLFNK